MSLPLHQKGHSEPHEQRPASEIILKNTSEIAFGSFRLVPAQRLLLQDGEPVALGGRAYDILLVLTSKAGEIVSKDEISSVVWPGLFVDESNLRVQVSSLRRALGESSSGNPYIVTIPGRGYSLSVDVTATEAAAKQPASKPGPAPTALNVPLLLKQLVGREELVALVDSKLSQRLVTLVGPGGVGKTSLGLAVAQNANSFADGVRVVELATLEDPRLVPTALASALGHPVRSENPLPGLLATLRDKQMLLVLDNCEHLIEAAASLSEQILIEAPAISVIATSREPLRAEGENVVHVTPLAFPAEGGSLSHEEALAFPALQLFLLRAKASDNGFALLETEGPLLVEICRRLDGIPLAIELAAARVHAFGITGLASLMDDRFRVLTSGRRTTLQRHQTLRSAIDWSYELLSPMERTVLRRLSVFQGAVSLAAATAVAGADILPAEFADIVADLVLKSLVVAEGAPTIRYRLLDSVRAYAREKLSDSGEDLEFARRHAEYFAAALARPAGGPGAAPEPSPTRSDSEISNVRVALDWCFSAQGDRNLGATLTAAAVPLWLSLSLLEECRSCVERALVALGPAAAQGGRREMQLYAALAGATINIKGASPETEAAWSAALAIARRLGDVDYQLRTLWGLWLHHYTSGPHSEGLSTAHRFQEIAKGAGRDDDVLIGFRMAGAAHWALGELADARLVVEQMLARYVAPADRSHLARYHFDQRAAATAVLAHTLWLQGFPDRAMRVALEVVDETSALQHDSSEFAAVALCGCRLALLTGDRSAAERLVNRLQELTKRQVNYGTWVRAYSAQMLIDRGDAEAGSQLLKTALTELPATAFHVQHSPFQAALAEGLAEAGRVAEAMAVIEEALTGSEAKEEQWCRAELMRVKGEILLRGPTEQAEAAEQAFASSLALARMQGALGWELRTATSLAKMHGALGRPKDGLDLLDPVLAKFEEGSRTADVAAAAALAKALAARRSTRSSLS